jgi:hypothetical protein
VTEDVVQLASTFREPDGWNGEGGRKLKRPKMLADSNCNAYGNGNDSIWLPGSWNIIGFNSTVLCGLSNQTKDAPINLFCRLSESSD